MTKKQSPPRLPALFALIFLLTNPCSVAGSQNGAASMTLMPIDETKLASDGAQYTDGQAVLLSASVSEVTLVTMNINGTRRITTYGVATIQQGGSRVGSLECNGRVLPEIDDQHPLDMLEDHSVEDWSPILVPPPGTRQQLKQGSLGILYLHDEVRPGAIAGMSKLIVDRTGGGAVPNSTRETRLERLSRCTLAASAVASATVDDNSAGLEVDRGASDPARPIRFVSSDGDGLPSASCGGRHGDWRAMIDGAARIAHHAYKLARVRSTAHHEHGITHPHHMLNSFLAIEEELVVGDGRVARHGKGFYHDIGESLTIRKKDISQQFAKMLCKTGFVKEMTRVHKDIGEHSHAFMMEMVGTQLIGAIGAIIKGAIIDPALGMMIGCFVDVLIGVFMVAVVGSVTAQIAGPLKTEVASSVGTMMAAMLPHVLSIMLSGSLSVRVSKALVGNLNVEINRFLDQEAAAAMSGTIIHQLSHTITNSITTSLNYGLTHTLTHTLSTSLSNSVTHYFYCTYCYYFGDYCDYCYYYQDFKWMHKQSWEGVKAAETYEDKQGRVPETENYGLFGFARRAGKQLGKGVKQEFGMGGGVGMDAPDSSDSLVGEGAKEAAEAYMTALKEAGVGTVPVGAIVARGSQAAQKAITEAGNEKKREIMEAAEKMQAIESLMKSSKDEIFMSDAELYEAKMTTRFALTYANNIVPEETDWYALGSRLVEPWVTKVLRLMYCCIETANAKEAKYDGLKKATVCMKYLPNGYDSVPTEEQARKAGHLKFMDNAARETLRTCSEDGSRLVKSVAFMPDSWEYKRLKDVMQDPSDMVKKKYRSFSWPSLSLRSAKSTMKFENSTLPGEMTALIGESIIEIKTELSPHDKARAKLRLIEGEGKNYLQEPAVMRKIAQGVCYTQGGAMCYSDESNPTYIPVAFVGEILDEDRKSQFAKTVTMSDKFCEHIDRSYDAFLELSNLLDIAQDDDLLQAIDGSRRYPVCPLTEIVSSGSVMSCGMADDKYVRTADPDPSYPAAGTCKSGGFFGSKQKDDPCSMFESLDANRASVLRKDCAMSNLVAFVTELAILTRNANEHYLMLETMWPLMKQSGHAMDIYPDELFLLNRLQSDLALPAEFKVEEIKTDSWGRVKTKNVFGVGGERIVLRYMLSTSSKATNGFFRPKGLPDVIREVFDDAKIKPAKSMTYMMPLLKMATLADTMATEKKVSKTDFSKGEQIKMIRSGLAVNGLFAREVERMREAKGRCELLRESGTTIDALREERCLPLPALLRALVALQSAFHKGEGPVSEALHSLTQLSVGFADMVTDLKLNRRSSPAKAIDNFVGVYLKRSSRIFHVLEEHIARVLGAKNAVMEVYRLPWHADGLRKVLEDHDAHPKSERITPMLDDVVRWSDAFVSSNEWVKLRDAFHKFVAYADELKLLPHSGGTDFIREEQSVNVAIPGAIALVQKEVVMVAEGKAAGWNLEENGPGVAFGSAEMSSGFMSPFSFKGGSVGTNQFPSIYGTGKSSTKGWPVTRPGEPLKYKQSKTSRHDFRLAGTADVEPLPAKNKELLDQMSRLCAEIYVLVNEFSKRLAPISDGSIKKVNLPKSVLEQTSRALGSYVITGGSTYVPVCTNRPEKKELTFPGVSEASFFGQAKFSPVCKPNRGVCASVDEEVCGGCVVPSGAQVATAVEALANERLQSVGASLIPTAPRTPPQRQPDVGTTPPQKIPEGQKLAELSKKHCPSPEKQAMRIAARELNHWIRAVKSPGQLQEQAVEAAKRAERGGDFGREMLPLVMADQKDYGRNTLGASKREQTSRLFDVEGYAHEECCVKGLARLIDYIDGIMPDMPKAVVAWPAIDRSHWLAGQYRSYYKYIEELGLKSEPQVILSGSMMHPVDLTRITGTKRAPSGQVTIDEKDFEAWHSTAAADNINVGIRALVEVLRGATCTDGAGYKRGVDDPEHQEVDDLSEL